MNTIQWLLRIVILAAVTIIGLRIFVVLLQRVPGLFVSLSAIAMGILVYALYKGSFRAVGLRDRRAVLWTMAACLVLFLISGSVLLFADR